MKLLFEIGVEELPAGELDMALATLAKHLTDGAAEHRLTIGTVRTLGTPRRLTVIVDDVAATAETVQETVTGPSAKAAFDADGNPTRAAQGFARGKGVDPSALIRVETPKGEYVAAVVTHEGRPAAEILTELLNSAFGAIPWKRSMRWGWGTDAFSRPVMWIVALLGEDVLPVSFGGRDAGRTTRGHRFMAPDPIELPSPEGYEAKLREAKVFADVDERREAIRERVRALVLAEGLTPIEDEDLLDEVVHLVEWPVPLLGTFDEELLEVPREVLVMSMASHQKYFAVEKAPGELSNHFVFVSNMEVPDPSVVVAGNLRVLRARLEDARFFYREDAKKGLAARVPELGRVTYIDQLGSVLDRVGRIEALVGPLAEALYPGDADVAATAARAAHLCKADLVTGMVYEFPELQGTMGRYYATAEGETPAVAEAIEAHYQPRGASDDPAATPAGVLVALADKLDAIAGCFAIGLVPSGSADPYALRRAALGIVRTALHHGLRFDLRALVDAALAGLPDAVAFDADAVAEDIVGFVQGRLRALLAADAPTDVVDAVVSVTLDDMPAAPRRVEVVARMRDNADFEPLAAAFKRVVNIVRKAVDEGGAFADLLTANTFDIDTARLDDGAEAGLHAAVEAAATQVDTALDAGDDEAVAACLIGLKGPIDAFFDDVMVNTDDPDVRANRLTLLARVRALFNRFADISRIQATA